MRLEGHCAYELAPKNLKLPSKILLLIALGHNSHHVNDSLLTNLQNAAAYMAESSHVILISTTLCNANTVAPNYLFYNSTKGAIEQRVRVMSKDLARRGICVNAVAPGPSGTDLFLRGKSEQVLKLIDAASPMNGIGTPDEIADAFAFLASNNSRWVTGQTVRVKEWLELIMQAKLNAEWNRPR